MSIILKGPTDISFAFLIMLLFWLVVGGKLFFTQLKINMQEFS